MLAVPTQRRAALSAGRILHINISLGQGIMGLDIMVVRHVGRPGAGRMTSLATAALPVTAP